MSAGAAHVTVGVPLVTAIDTFAAAVESVAESVGVYGTESGCPAPLPSTVPGAGEYTNVPGTLAVALNCAGPRGVPYGMSAGAVHVMAGVRRFALVVTVTPADVVDRPAASRARALSVCAPLDAVVESQLIAYGSAVTSEPSGAPSSRNCTPATPTSSDAFA